LAAFFTGVATAIKFPFVFFMMYPICALLINSKQLDVKKPPLKPLGFVFVFALCGLLLFSPKWFVDKAFFTKTFLTELRPYVLGARVLEVDTPINHFAYLVLYHLFYADFPLATMLFVIGVVILYRQNKRHNFTNSFYTLVLPVSMFIFFFYNLFTTFLVFRTYYPFFCLCIFFTSYALSELFDKKKLRIAIVALSIFMVFRGTLFVHILIERSRGQVITDALTQHEEWNRRKMTVIYGDIYIPNSAYIPERKYAYDWPDFYHKSPANLALRPGEFGIVGAVEYAFAKISLFHSGMEKEKLRSRWVDFREGHKDYLIGVSYPPYYHYVFGGWIPGSSLAFIEFPVNYIYYRPYETGEKAPNPQKYYPLYEIDDWRGYLEAIARIDCTIILSGSEGLPEDFVREVFAVFPVDVDTSLLSGQASAFVIQPANAEQSLIFSQNNEEATMLLTKTIGAQSSISVSAESNVITIDDRYYATYAPGFNIVVYDNNMKCVMDWRSLTFDANSGSVALYK
jgi:hypothetical protein